MIGVGVIARDFAGNVLGAMCSVHRYISDPTIAEAYGARQAAEFGCFLGLQTVILEGHALEVVAALGRDDEGAGKYGNLDGEARRILNGSRSWTVHHVRREGNQAAHTVAQFAVSQQRNKVWFGT